MSKLFSRLAFLTLMAVGNGAVAAEAIGWITHLDHVSDRLVLDDGRTFGVSEEINFGSLSDGVRVRVDYDTFNGERIARDIELAPSVPHNAELAADENQPENCSAHENNRLVADYKTAPTASC